MKMILIYKQSISYYFIFLDLITATFYYYLSVLRGGFRMSRTKKITEEEVRKELEANIAKITKKLNNNEDVLVKTKPQGVKVVALKPEILN